jgi:hypothetical protein
VNRTVIVTGGRNWSDAEILGKALDQLHARHGFTLLVEGGAKGADTLAREWAARNRVSRQTVPADWDRWGKSAGSKRNIKMLEDYPGALVVAFPMPESRGTWHCVREAKKRDHVVVIGFPGGRLESA